MKHRIWLLALLLSLSTLLYGCGIFTSNESSTENSSESSEESSESSFEEQEDSVYAAGTEIAGVDLSGKTASEALSALEAVNYSDVQITLTLENDNYVYKGSDFSLKLMAAESLEKGAAVLSYDETAIQTVADKLTEELKQDPVDAAVVSFTDGEFEYSEDENGLTVKTDELVSTLTGALYECTGKDITLEIPVETTKAEVTLDYLKECTVIIGSYTTEYSTWETNRSQNLETAARKVNGTIVQPGETFSYNEALRPLTEEEGFTYASVISGGEYVDGIGGGGCQVATTIYDAVLYAELEVTDRECHAYPASYVPLGMDCTVYDPYIDFQFVNNTDMPIYLQVWCVDGECGCIIYGKEIHDPSREVSFYYETVEVIDKPATIEVADDTMYEGETEVISYGHIGYVVETYKTVTENGVTYTEWFSESRYDNSADKIRVGTKKVENEESSEPIEESSEPIEESSEPIEESSEPIEESSEPIEESSEPIEESSEPEEESSEPKDESSETSDESSEPTEESSEPVEESSEPVEESSEPAEESSEPVEESSAPAEESTVETTDESSETGGESSSEEGGESSSDEGEGGEAGSSEEESTEESNSDEGTTDDGTSDEGTTDEGSTDDGATDEGTTDDGADAETDTGADTETGTDTDTDGSTDGGNE